MAARRLRAGETSATKNVSTYARQQTGRQKEMSTLDALIGQGRVLMMQGKYDEAWSRL